MSNDFEINNNEFLEQCDSRDVLSFETDYLVNISKFKDIVHYSFSKTRISSICDCITRNSSLQNSNAWFYEGKKCEILQAGSQGWQKGKIKINVTLEFIPDESEEKSPLDDVRQELNKDNS